MKQFNTREEFLLDEISHYNCENRSVMDNGKTCSYMPAHANTLGCAIGRHLEPELQVRLQRDDNSVGESETFDMLPDWMKELGGDFLLECQALHDTEHNWNSTGLTFGGKAKVNAIISEFNLNIPQFLI